MNVVGVVVIQPDPISHVKAKRFRCGIQAFKGLPNGLVGPFMHVASQLIASFIAILNDQGCEEAKDPQQDHDKA